MGLDPLTQNDAWANALRNEADRELKRCASNSAMAACAAANSPPVLKEIWPDPTSVSSGIVRCANAPQPAECTPPARALFNSSVIGPICTTGATHSQNQPYSGSRRSGSACENGEKGNGNACEKGEKGKGSASSAAFSSPSARPSSGKSFGKGAKDSGKDGAWGQYRSSIANLAGSPPSRAPPAARAAVPQLLLPPAKLLGLPKDWFLPQVLGLEA